MPRMIVLDKVQEPMVAELSAVIDKLGSRDREFAASLVSNFGRWGQLSEKQIKWVDVLTQRATQPAPKAEEVFNFAAIQHLFTHASRNLRRVKIKLQAKDGTPVVLGRAGPNSKYAGQILITDGLPFGQNRYFGRVDVGGEFYPTARANEDVKAVIREFADDPAGVAARYGKLTGGCSFCNHSLKDERSTEVGYGPVCAKNFGLPWGR